MSCHTLCTTCLVLFLCGCASPEAWSLDGRPLDPPALAADVRAEREAKLIYAQERYWRDPTDRDAIIWFGRRLAYLGRYRDAVHTYRQGIAQQPDEPRFYRHRGHRYITLRKFDLAVEDLTRAGTLIENTPDEVEPDGMPNARNIPTSTLHFNVWYHLGLAHYLSGDLQQALESYRKCIAVSKNPDALCATSHWLYMTLRRLGRNEEAQQVLTPIHKDLDVIENHGYHRLLLMYRGELSEDELAPPKDKEADGIQSATVGYGIPNWHHYPGRKEKARALMEAILTGEQWAAFGYIAAEADLVRK